MNRGIFVYQALFFQPYIIITTVPLFFLTVWLFPHRYVLFLFWAYYIFALLVTLFIKNISSKLHILHEKKMLRLFPGNSATITIGLQNASRFPVPSGKLTIKLDPSLNEMNEKKLTDLRGTAKQFQFMLPAKKNVYFQLKIIPQQRGIYFLEESELIITDWLGTATIHFPPLDRLDTKILVYPLPKPLPEMKALEKILPGRNGASFSYFKDESVIVGVKPYEGEGFRQIHWKATAKSQSLAAKKYEPVVQRGITICLVLSSPAAYAYHDKMEDMISYAAFLCQLAASKKIPFELFVNLYQQSVPIGLNMDEGMKHLGVCLTTLAQIKTEAVLVNEQSFAKYVNTQSSSSALTIFISGTGKRESRIKNTVYVDENGRLSGGDCIAAAAL
ncbi:hypothetical protein CVD28_13730 [Bacillus sp. M6-12]|uniref:DUF58 domain-containing protein n=1 Tax=Bacillus sp. M6-12 TaxID=2054166 RepID=UPI000C78CDFA|nr:DUF58 domain-containing protein [Bacillus sp. M6-12]PLS17109.1 hypothetical protein CVD28_13730 [Bacillus sp. M6-12]